MDDPPTLRTRLNAARLERFVGREREIEQFRSALASDNVAVLYLYGPGGIGKSSLLDVFAHHAQPMTVVRIDARDIDATPAAFQHALVPFDNNSAEAVACGTTPVLLMLDTWELAAPIDNWLRDVLLPGLPANTTVVISSRNPPGPEWTAHRSWAPLLAVIGMRNLLPHESEAFLRAQGVEPSRTELLAALSYGHPLALTLVSTLERESAGGIGGFSYRDRPDLVHALLERCLHTMPRGRQRLALSICAHARVTTEALLREVLELDDAGSLFDWLRSLSIMQEGPFGIFPHDLARDVIDADFRWRDLQGYSDMHARIRALILRRVRALHGLEQQQAVSDLLYLHRTGPVMGRVHVWDTVGYGRTVPATPEDLPMILEMVERFEGADSAKIASYWWERMPDAFSVFRGVGNEIFGFNACLLLAEPDVESAEIDPAIAAMWRTIDARGPLRFGEVALYDRFQMDRVAHHAPSTGVNMMAMCSLLHWVTTPNLGWSFLSNSQPDLWDSVFEYLDQHPYPESAFRVGEREFVTYSHDWRAIPPDSWLEMMGTKEIASEESPRPSPPGSVAVQVLARPDFERAVRRALRDLHDPLALERNPLSHSRLMSGPTEIKRDEKSTLRERLLSAIRLLEQSPRDAKLYRAVERTYLKPAKSQELAAEALGLPFNTYRYHLSGAIRRIVDELWRIELGF